MENLKVQKKIFEALEDSHSKEYLISDNTGSGETSGGSDDTVECCNSDKRNQEG